MKSYKQFIAETTEEVTKSELFKNVAKGTVFIYKGERYVKYSRTTANNPRGKKTKIGPDKIVRRIVKPIKESILNEQASNVYPSQSDGNPIYGDKQIGFVRLKSKSEVGRILLRASKEDIKLYGKGTCRIETKDTKRNPEIASIVKIDPFKGKIIWLDEKVYSGETDDIIWERPKKFYELIMQGDEAEYGFGKWIKVLGY